MRDIPMFTTENGVASLCLGNVAYTKTAYIYIRDTQVPEAFLKECFDFCRSVGAESVYATGHSYLSMYEQAVSVLEMQCDSLTDNTVANLIPVQDNTLEEWRSIYNAKMANVPNAAYITYHGAKKYLQEGNCYFVYKENKMIGVGVVGDHKIDAVASVCRGGGKDVVLALCKYLNGVPVTLRVADSNSKAIQLYHSLGFEVCSVAERWYKII